MTAVLGISGLYHDSAACIIRDGRIVAAAQEERFTRKKHDAAFPVRAIEYCLREAQIGPGGIDWAVFYEKPFTKFVRILRTQIASAPRSWRAFLQAAPSWAGDKLWIPYKIERTLRKLGVGPPKNIGFTEHHESHAASAFFPSPFEEAAILTMDGVGEWATTTLGHGRGNRIEMLGEIRFPHSLGLLYSAFTYFCGFRVNSGEYKLMGLAPYGEPAYADLIRKHLIKIFDDGSFSLDMRYFNYVAGLTMTSARFDALFGGPPRRPETPITKREMDLAASIQAITEEIVLKLARMARARTGATNLCLAGGVALNCVANGELLRDGAFDDVFIQPAAGDAGGALGAAAYCWYHTLGNERVVDGVHDSMQGAYLGPSFSDAEVESFLRKNGYPFRRLSAQEWPREIARTIAEEKVVGLCHGRMEFGPRALGNRSIVGDPRSPKMQSVMNLKIKYRESFRPFAPSVLRERVQELFELDRASPYMLLVADVREDRRRNGHTASDDLTAWVNQVRSDIPAVTHVDFSARIQTVERETAPRYHALIEEFGRLTGCPVIINTSFNVRGEPLVCTPEDAYRCFMRTEMDVLVLESFLLEKSAQPAMAGDSAWREEFALD